MYKKMATHTHTRRRTSAASVDAAIKRTSSSVVQAGKKRNSSNRRPTRRSSQATPLSHVTNALASVNVAQTKSKKRSSSTAAAMAAAAAQSMLTPRKAKNSHQAPPHTQHKKKAPRAVEPTGENRGIQRINRIAGRWGLNQEEALDIVRAFEEQQTVPGTGRRKKSVISVAQRWRLSVQDALEICKSFEEQQSHHHQYDEAEA